jgi:Fe-S cluster assembly scaffold protein SufB
LTLRIYLHETRQVAPDVFRGSLTGRGAVASSTASSGGETLHGRGKRVIRSRPGPAEVIARTISSGGDITSRGHLIGDAPGIKAHLECRGLILREGSRIYAVPELEGRVPNIDMSHEAAVGKIAEEEIQYLMSRGLTAEEATAIVRGFLDIEIKGLPEQLQEEIRKSIRKAEEGERLL